MDFKKILGTVALTVTATAALATPQYTGDTTADFTGNNANDLGFDNAGYYIWNEKADASTWHIVWTGKGANEATPSWFGKVYFENFKLDTVEEFKFETNGSDKLTITNTMFDEAFEWTALTNNANGVDGITFTLDDSYELMSLSLGSTLFSGLDTISTDPGVASTGIYIGSEKLGTNVLVTQKGPFKYQKFEILVPEPATMALFGLGIVGLAASRRRNKNVAA